MIVERGASTGRITRLRKQCPECNLLCNLSRITVVDSEIRCIDCAPGEADPWYVPSETEQ